MSAAKYMKDNGTNHAVNFVIMVILLFMASWINTGDAEDGDLNAQVDSNTISLETKASIDYVDDKAAEVIRLHEEKEAAIFEPIKQDLSDIKNYLFYNQLPKDVK